MEPKTLHTPGKHSASPPEILKVERVRMRPFPVIGVAVLVLTVRCV